MVKITFDEYMDMSEKIIDKEGMLIAEQFFLGDIPFEEFAEQLWRAIPEENKYAFIKLAKLG